MKCDIDWIYPLTSHLPRISVVIFEKIFRNNRGNVTSQIEMSLNNWRCKQIVPHIFEPNIFLTFGHFHQNIILHFPILLKRSVIFCETWHVLTGEGCKVTISWGLFAFIYCGDMEDLYQVQGSHQQCWHWFSRHRYTIMFFITFSILSSLENYGEILAKKTIILGKWKIPHVDSLKLLF